MFSETEFSDHYINYSLKSIYFVHWGQSSKQVIDPLLSIIELSACSFLEVTNNWFIIYNMLNFQNILHDS